MADMARASAWALYGDYLIELESTERGWRIVEITHSMVAAKNFRPPSVYHRDRASAESGGRPLIDPAARKASQAQKGTPRNVQRGPRPRGFL
jgi:hypothetical protein